MPMQMVTLEPEIPPYSSGNGMPRMPLSAKSFSMSFGYSPVWSISAARGATRSCTSSRIVSRIATCSVLNSKSMPVRLSRVQQCPGDHDPLHLVRAFVDLERLRVADVALEWASLARSLLARDLQRVERDLHRGVGAVELGHRRLAGEWLAPRAQPRRAVCEQAGRLDTRGHVRQGEIISLFMTALAHQLARLVDRGLRDAERLARDADAPRIQGAHRDLEARAF